MADVGELYTDARTRKLDKRIREVYTQAEKDILEKMNEFNEKYKTKYKIHQQELKDGKITQEQFDNWMKGQIFQGKQWMDKREQIARTLAESNQVALNMLNEERVNVFTFNSNYEAYSLEHGAGINFGFNLYDESTVKNLIQKEPTLLPSKKLDLSKDIPWNMKNISRQVTQGIIQGESLDKIAKRIANEVGSTNEKAMMRSARTAMTGAQNSGRNLRMQDAKSMGINVVKEWMATLDEHTRDSHRDMDGERVTVGDKWHHYKFSNGCEYPGDPNGPPHEVYNCRCTLVSSVEDYPDEYERYNNIDGHPIENMTYREWEKAKQRDNGQYTDFLNIRGPLGNDCVNAMETMLNFTKEEDAKDLFYKFQDKLKVIETNLTNDGAYYSRDDGGIHINAANIQQGDNLHVPYQTVFHEFGHNIDNVGASTKDGYMSVEYKNGILEKKIKEDWNDFKVQYLLDNTDKWASEGYEIRSLLRELNKRQPDKGWYDIVRQHRDGDITTEEILEKYGEKMARMYLNMGDYYVTRVNDDVIKMLKAENMPLSERGSISDIIGGLLCSNGKNNWYDYPLGAGHEFN